MLATSHAHWTARLVAGRPHAGWAVTGSVLPDVPAAIRGAWVIARRAPRQEALDRIYHRPPWREVHLTAHAVWGPLLLLVVSRGARARALAAGWAGHLAVDYVTHHDDAWPPVWPLSMRRWRAPVSYWQREHHAVALLTADVVGSLGFRQGRATPLGLVAAGVTLHALRRAGGPDPGSPLGLVADAASRGRDLDQRRMAKTLRGPLRRKGARGRGARDPHGSGGRSAGRAAGQER